MDNTGIDLNGKFIHIDESWLKIKELSLVQMALLVTIKGLKGDGGMCYASNGYLARFLHVSENTVGNNLKKLEKMGLIKRVNPKSRDRRIVVLDSALDRFLRNEYNHKNCGDSHKATNIGLIENDMTTKIVANDHKNCDDTPQKLGAIIIDNNNSDIIPNQIEKNNFSINNINGVTEEPSAESDFQNSPEWRQFVQNAIQMQVPVGLLNLIRAKVGSNVMLARSEFTDAIKAGADPALIYYAAMQTYNKPGSLAATLETLGIDVEIPAEIQTEADQVVSRVLCDAETNFKKQKG